MSETRGSKQSVVILVIGAMVIGLVGIDIGMRLAGGRGTAVTATLPPPAAPQPAPVMEPKPYPPSAPTPDGAAPASAPDGAAPAPDRAAPAKPVAPERAAIEKAVRDWGEKGMPGCTMDIEQEDKWAFASVTEPQGTGFVVLCRKDDGHWKVLEAGEELTGSGKKYNVPENLRKRWFLNE
jgi:hypothetical protein